VDSGRIDQAMVAPEAAEEAVATRRPAAASAVRRAG
jgi:hypothetical protein